MSKILFASLSLALFLISHSASAGLLISIDKDYQRMTVSDGQHIYVWRVSTGGPGYSTPNGSYHPFRLEAEHFSKEWDDAPMPHSIFFTERGHAIHGTSHTSALGTPVSHGCVRLAPDNAAFLFKLVEVAGLNETQIQVGGTDPAVADFGKMPSVSFRLGSRQLELAPFDRWVRLLDGRGG